MSQRTITQLLAATMLTALPAIGHAQAVEAPDTAGTSAQASPADAAGLGDIIVTARRREESAQRTPIALTAITTAGLERAQVRTVEDIQRLAPNISISAGAPSSAGFAFLSFRGQANLEALTTNDPAIGTYVDGIYIGRPAQGLFDLVDTARVEVLRGPQGTLFGRNTIGGAINITTNQPTDRLGGWAEVQLGNYDDRRYTGVLNLPLADDGIGLRVAARHVEHDGYGRDISTDRPLFNILGDNYVRANLKIAPTGSRWHVAISGDYDKTHGSGTLTNLSGWNRQSLLGALGLNLDPYVVSKSHNFYSSYGTNGEFGAGSRIGDSLKTYGIAGTVAVDLGAVNVKSITGARKLVSFGYQDLDGTPIDLLGVFAQYGVKQVSQELQLTGSLGKLDWITGAYLFRETSHDFSINQVLGFLKIPPSFNDAKVTNISRAAFAQVYYKFSSRLRASAGIRYTIDTRKVVLHNLDVYKDPSSCNVTVDMAGGPCNQTLDKDFKYPAWDAGLDYQLTPTVFVYAKTSGAFMAGGWNARAGSPTSFSPEEAKSVEAGLKADLFGHRLRTNVAIFHTWQSDVQRSVGRVVGTISTQYTLNAGDAHVSGAEFEATAAPWEGMQLGASLGLIDAHYDRGTFTSQQLVNGVAYTVDRSGEPLPQVPKITYNFSATQSLPTSIGTLELHADYAYIGKQTYYVDTPAAAQPDSVKQQYDEANQLAKAAGYGLFNVRASMELSSPKIQITGFVRNLTDKKYVSRTYANLYKDLGYAQQFPGQPRTYGVSVRVNFGE